MARTNLLTEDQLAALCQVSPWTIRDWRRSGRIPFVQMSPKVIRYDYESVMRALSQKPPSQSQDVVCPECKKVFRVHLPTMAAESDSAEQPESRTTWVRCNACDRIIRKSETGPDLCIPCFCKSHPSDCEWDIPEDEDD